MTNQNEMQQKPKNIYTVPRLTNYGDVRLLTQGGSVDKVENNGHPDGKN